MFLYSKIIQCKITIWLMLIRVCCCKRVFLIVSCRAGGNQWRCIFKYEAGFGGVAVERGVDDDGEGSVRMLQREYGHLQEQLRSSEELNATLRSELDLTRSIVKHNPQSQTEDKQPERPNTSASKTINSGRVPLGLYNVIVCKQRWAQIHQNVFFLKYCVEKFI